GPGAAKRRRDRIRRASHRGRRERRARRVLRSWRLRDVAREEDESNAVRARDCGPFRPDPRAASTRVPSLKRQGHEIAVRLVRLEVRIERVARTETPEVRADD